ncbi:hypothetical protein B0H14DRAFT_2919012 [Mycena olivaceomarginata]|nr:hypothetical protein B0H14DRAFT_2919012 [Mycena olivaceomarginata]
MPRSKRSKLVSLTKVAKKTKEQKGAMIKDLQENAEKWKYCWLFQVGAMRNTHLKTVRKTVAKASRAPTARIFFGRSAVMAKALGTTPEEEHRMGIHKLAKQIQGQVGVLFTDTEPDETFARAGNIASRTVILPPWSHPPEPFPHNEEHQLRKLGLSTYMNKGVPSLHNPHELCKKGKPLTSEQAQLLKLIGEKMVVFRVALISRWSAATGDVVQIEGQPSSEELGDAGDDVEDAMDE